MYHISPISADAGESKPFVMLPGMVCREEEIIKVSHDGNADYRLSDAWAKESNAIFFDAFRTAVQ